MGGVSVQEVPDPSPLAISSIACSTSTYADRTRIPVSGSSSRITRAASRPSAVRVGGIPDVDHDQVRLRRANEGEQLRGVPGLSDHLKPGTLEQTRQAFPEENIIVGHRHPPRTHLRPFA